MNFRELAKEVRDRLNHKEAVENPEFLLQLKNLLSEYDRILNKAIILLGYYADKENWDKELGGVHVDPSTAARAFLNNLGENYDI